MVMVLVGCIVLVSALPVVEAAWDGQRADTAHRGLDRHLRSRGWAVGDVSKRAPSRYAPIPETYRRPTPHEILEELLGGAPADSAAGKGAMPRGRINMLDRADEDGDIVMELAPSTPILVVKDLGRWLLVAVRHEGRTQSGWLRRRSVVILP
jgi:hypothetical protein